MIKVDDALDDGSEPHMFTPATSGVATNGLPIYSWTQAANQLTRESTGWVFSQGPITVTYAFRLSAPNGGMPDTASGFSRFNAAQIEAAETSLQ